MTVTLELSRAGVFVPPVFFDSAGSSLEAEGFRWSFSAILSRTAISVCCPALHVMAL
jgi:hypothetical protein